MCRCCQNCWEDFYWNCFEEKFCYDESIANYNPEEDEEYIASQKNGSVLGRIQTTDNNNLSVQPPICDQPLGRGNSMLISNAKIHEEDYRRETQTNVPMLGPEILAVFANSQIFQDHQPTKLNRISTKTHIAGIHTPNRDLPSTPKESEQDRLIRRLEAQLNNPDAATDATDSIKQPAITPINISGTGTPEKRITFTLTTDSSPEGSHGSLGSLTTPHKFEVIAEERAEINMRNLQQQHSLDLQRSAAAAAAANNKDNIDTNHEEVVLRPRIFDRAPHLMPPGGLAVAPKKQLRTTKSVPHFKVRATSSETDIFTITGSGGQISMTPEVPSISFSNLPKNYEDTPTIEKYRVSQSLYSIQTANEARASQQDYSMPRYFRHSGMIGLSNEMLAGSSSATSFSSSREDVPRRPEKEKSKRLQMLRGNLPPLLIHSVSFRKNREEGKQLD